MNTCLKFPFVLTLITFIISFSTYANICPRCRWQYDEPKKNKKIAEIPLCPECTEFLNEDIKKAIGREVFGVADVADVAWEKRVLQDESRRRRGVLESFKRQRRESRKRGWFFLGIMILIWGVCELVKCVWVKIKS